MILLISWIGGLLIGTVLAIRTGNAYFSMLCAAAQNRVSIVWLVIAALLPFLICDFAAKKGWQWLIYSLCFIKALTFSHGALCASAAFGSAGWLVQPMLLFSNLLLTPFFCWFCLRCIRRRRSSSRDLGICLAVWLAVSYLDFYLVSPFLAMLIEQ